MLLREFPNGFNCRGLARISYHKRKRGTGGILFREYCFGEENSLSLTEFWGKLGEFGEKLGEFTLTHK